MEEAQKRMVEQQKALYESHVAKNRVLAAEMQKDIDALNRKIRQQKEYITGLSTSVMNLSQASYKDLTITVKALKRELRSGNIERGTEKWKILTEALRQANQELKNIREESAAVDKEVGKSSIWTFLKKFNDIGFAITNFFGMEQGISGIISKVQSLAQESMEVAKNAEGIELAFNRINKPGLLANLRKETHGTIDDIQLMQQAVKFQNFDLPVEQLGKLLAFAQQTAKDTGQSIDYMVNSIVDGMSRQSVKILDNLGLSATKIKEKVKETGDFTTGVIAMIEERMDGMGEYTDTAADRAARATARVVNAQKELGEQLLPIRSELASVFGQAKLGMLNALTWILKNRDAFAALGKAVVVWAATMTAAMLVDKAATVQAKLHAAAVAVNAAVTKAWTAATNVLKSSLEAVKLVMALCTGGTNAYTAALERAKAASMTNPWTALATVLLTVGTVIYGVVKHLQNQKKAAKEAADATNIFVLNQKNMQAITKEANQKVAEEITRIDVLYRKLKDSKAAYGERKSALEEIKKLVPDYHGALTKEGELINDNSKALRDYCDNLIKAARAQAAFQKMAELQSKYLDSQTLRDDTRNNQYELIGKMSQYGFDPTRGDRLQYVAGQGTYVAGKPDRTLSSAETRQLNFYIKQYNANQKIIKQEESKLSLLQQQSEALQSQVDVAATGGGGSGGNSGGGGKTTTSTGGTGGKTTLEDALKEQEDAITKSAERAQIVLTLKYRQSLVSYSDYVAQQTKITRDSLAERVQLYIRSNATNLDAYYKALKDQSDFDDEQNKAKAKKDEVAIEQERLRKTYAAKQSIFDQTELDNKLFEIDQAALLERLKLYKEGTKEYEDIADKIEASEQSHQQKLQEQWKKSLEDARSKLQQYRKDMGKETLAEQEIAEKEAARNLFQTLVDNGEMTKDEYDEVIEYIKNKYKNLRAEQNSDATLKSQGADMLQKAKTRANVSGSESSGDSSVVGIFSAFNAVKQQKQINEALDQLYNEDKTKYAQVQEAKRQLSQETTDKIIAGAQAALGGISNILSSASSYAQACSDLETARISANYQKQIDAAGNNSKKRERLEKKRDKELAKAKTKANKKAMKIEIAQALAQTALAAITSYASASKVSWILGPIAAALATAAGMMQIATIKKQHQAEEAGYYEGGFTSGANYRRKAGVVHEGEFVANHQAVNNPQLAPTLNLLDWAQRNNRVSSLTAEDVSRANGGGAPTVVAPTNVTVTTDNSELRDTLDNTNETLDRLGDKIERMHIDFSVEEFKRAERHWNVLQGNK